MSYKSILPLLLLTGLTCYGHPQPLYKADTDLYLLGKIWGFLKYYHPALTEGKVDWDDALLRFLPVYKQVKTERQRDDSLLAWIDRLGPVGECPACRDTLLKGARLTPDLTWMEKAGLSAGLHARLRQIALNRNIKAQYYVRFMADEGVNMLLFDHEKIYSRISYPDTTYGLLCLYRFWNAIEYWYPYKYHLRMPWDDVLKAFIPRMAVEADLRQYVLDTKALVSQIDDSHGWFVWAQEREVCGKYMLPVTLQAVEGRWIVTSILNDGLAREAGLRAGDIVDSMNGKSMADRVRELSPYCPASNAASLLSKLSNSIIRSTNSLADLVIDRGGERRTLRAGTFVYPLYNTLDLRPPYFDYQRDSAFCLLDGGIGYINMYRLKREDSIRFKDMIAKASGLIIDNRQNVDALSNSSAVDIIARLILPEHTDIAMFSYPQPTYPGVFSLSRPGSMGFPEASPSYAGKIAILINEHTMSVGEFMSMAFRRALHARLVGVTTAGADGNVTYLSLPDGAVVQFTGLGVYYPDGRETQRIGIQPDIVARQSLAGFLANKDEQLERAIAWVRSKGE